MTEQPPEPSWFDEDHRNVTGAFNLAEEWYANALAALLRMDPMAPSKELISAHRKVRSMEKKYEEALLVLRSHEKRAKKNGWGPWKKA